MVGSLQSIYLLISLFNSGGSIVVKIILTVAVVVVVVVKVILCIYKMIHSINLCFDLNGNSKKMNCHENNIFTIVLQTKVCMLCKFNILIVIMFVLCCTSNSRIVLTSCTLLGVSCIDISCII